MNTKEAAKKWGISERTVLKYIKEHRIPYEKDGKSYQIADNLPKPLIIHKNVKITANRIRAYIIKATQRELFIDETVSWEK